MKIKILDKKKKFSAMEKKFYRRLVKEEIKKKGDHLLWSRKGTFVVELNRSKKHLTGYARYDAPFIWLRLPPGILCHEEVVHLIEHEVGHCYGLRHKDGMDRWPCYCKVKGYSHIWERNNKVVSKA
jgi:hypothetical protein